MLNATFSTPTEIKTVEDGERTIPWYPLLGLVYGVVVFVGAQLLAGFIAAGVIYARYGQGAHATLLFASPAFQFYFVLLAEGLTIAALILFMRHYNTKPQAIGFVRPRLRDFGTALLALPAYYILFIGVAAVAKLVFPALDVSQKQELGFDSVVGLTDQLFTFVSLVVLAPLAEEFLFRGFIYTTLRGSIGILLAAMITSVIFGAGHLAEGGATGLLYIGAIQTFCLSLILIFIRQKSKSLWPGIWLHAANNGIAFVVIYVLHSQ